MPDRCPECGAVGSLTPIDADLDQMSEGEEADYEAGVWVSLLPAPAPAKAGAAHKPLEDTALSAGRP
jgi:hypothetical protein